MRQTHFSNGL
ncbi:hypothetical protein D046_8408A, partial [Vibrio parahaemolyticus V-223/04]